MHINLRGQYCHDRAAAGALAGTGPEMRLAGVGAVLLESAPAGTVESGPRPGPLLPQHSLPCHPLGVSPGLQSAPAAVGIGRAHAVPAGGVYLTRSHLHSGHLQAGGGGQLSKGGGGEGGVPDRRVSMR